MPLLNLVQRKPVWTFGLAATLALWVLLPREAAPIDSGLFMVGTQGGGPSTVRSGPRINVFEADGWRHSLKDGRLQPVARLPLPYFFGFSRRTDLLHGVHFTPAAYLAQIEDLHASFSRQHDILMYYGGIRRHPKLEGLNFNAWSGHDLARLRALGCRPFIGLETMDRAAIRSLAWRLKEARYGKLNRIYIRIGAEPTYSSYGTEDGTSKGKRHTAKAYAAYRRHFARTSDYIHELNRRCGLDIHTVFAGTNQEDFARYTPPDSLFDAIGYDLYITPENKAGVLKQLHALARRYPNKPLVIPELGIASAGPSRRFWQKPGATADPQWAEDALGDILKELSRHPAGVEEITVFSVNVSGRISDRRWNWAWTPRMYEMLKEWKASPRRWRKEGFHRYDPLSYPVGRDVLFMNRPESRILYRKLSASQAPGVPLFQEIRFSARNGRWTHRLRTVYFENGNIIEA